MPPKPSICRLASACAGMAREPRVEHALHPRVPLQEFRHGLGIGCMPFHAQRQRLDAAQDEIAVEGAGYAARHAAQGMQPLAELGRARHEEAAEHVGMPAEVLRRRMHDDVAAELERPLEKRRGKRVVHDREDAVAFRERRCAAEVLDAQQRVGRASPATASSFAAGSRPRSRRGRSNPRTRPAGPALRGRTSLRMRKVPP